MKIAYNPITAEALTTAPANNDITFDLKGLNIFVRGVKFKGTDTTYSVFKKHTSSSGGGYNGLVPVPSYTSTNVRFLREDGTWQVPSNQYTYSSLTNQDLDTLKTEGKWYYLGGGNTVTNGPSDISKGGELYVGRNASGYRYQKVISYDGLIWFRIWNSSSWSDWKRWYIDANTDSKVLQSNTTTANYRPIILGYNNNADHNDISTSVTLLVYTTTSIYAQPSTGSLWATKLYSGGKPVLTDHLSLSNYVTLNTTLTITGLKTFTSQINSSLNTTTYLEGNKGKAIINSTAGAGQYVMLFKGNSTNGYFTHGVYLGKYLLQYTAKSTVTAGTNSVTKSTTLLDESGNSLFPGNVTAPKFIGSLLGNADSATKLTTSAGSATRPIYFADGKPVAGTYTFGNAIGNAAINNGTVNSNLNADLLDGLHSSSFLRLQTISGTTDVNTLKDTRLYYTTSDAASLELVNPPFTNTFSMILVANLINGDTDWRRSIIAFNPYGDMKIFNDRGTSGDGGVWYTVLTSGNYGSIADSRYVTSLGTSGNYLTWTKNGTTNNITIPYATLASKWTTARTITLGSYLSGSVSLDGSVNVTLKANVLGLTTQGRKTAISGTTVPSAGVRLYEVYNNGYPTTYGNLLSIRGGGSAELLLAWKNTQRIYVRSKSDVSTEEWTAWKTVAFIDDNVASATTVKVSLHTTNNTNYPLVWSNLNNTSTNNSSLYKSYNHLCYNPSTKLLIVSGGVNAGNVYINGVNRIYASSTDTTHQLNLMCEATYAKIQSNGSIPLAINPDGNNVGIGTTAPSLRLHVNGNTYTTGYVSGNTLTSRVAKGTAPLTVTSTTKVNNLNVDMLDNYHETAFPRLVGIKSGTWNWNDVIRAGYYKIQSGTITNHPSGIYGFGMAEVITTENHNDGENRELQIYYPHSQTNNIAIWLRMHNSSAQGSGWGSWVGVPNTNGNIASATKLLNKRTLWGQSFDGTANVSGNMTGVGSISASGDIILSQNGSTGTRQLRIQCGDNDYGRIAAGATASNAGWLEIATADDGNEPIYVRQYSGVYSTVKRTLTLLDGSGNTSMPGSLTVVGTVLGNILKSTVATGTAPLTVASTTKVANLNADFIDNFHATGTSGNALRKSGYLTSGTKGLSSYWGKVASFTWNGLYNDLDITLYMHSAFNVVRGIVHIRARWNSSSSVNVNCWIVTGNLDANDLRLYYNTSSATSSLELWYNVGGLWGVINTSIISETGRTSTETFRVTLYNTSFSTVQTPSLSSYVSGSYIHLYNSVDVANKLGTSTIGGSTTPIYLSSGTPKTCSASSEGTASTIAVRDSSGDLKCRLVRPTYNNQTTISGALAFRVNNSSDNYIRFCSSTSAIRTWLGVASSGHTHSQYVTSLGTSGNYLTWTRNGRTYNITVPYAINADKLDGYNANTSLNPFGKIPTIGSDGVMEVGRYLDFHYNSSDTSDYRTRLLINHSSGSYTATLPAKSGTLAMTSDIPTVTNYYWANIKVSASSSTRTSPTFSTAYTSNWFRSTGLTGWYSLTYGGGWYMTDTTWLRSYNNKGVVAKRYYASDWASATYLLRSDGGAAAFNWSGLSGLPTWLWGGNSLHLYYIYNPSNFRVSYATSAGNADTLDGLHGSRYTLCLGGPNYITITVGGSSNTYYPVIISSVSSYYPLLFVNISRTYNETAPDSWNTSTHKGGLTMTLLWNGSKYWDGNGGGKIGFYLNCVYLKLLYSTMVGGLDTSTSGTVVWLRGGTATYHIHSMNGTSVSATVYTSTYTDAASRSFAPRTSPSSVTVKWPGTVDTANKLGTTTVGSSTKGIYLNGGSPVAMTYSLNANVNSGSSGKLAYYSGTNSIDDYTSTKGSSSTPIYLNAGIPTVCTGVMVKYWAIYTINGYDGPSVTYSKRAGNYNFVTSSSKRDTGRYTIGTVYPSGLTWYTTLVWAVGALNLALSDKSSNSLLYCTLIRGYLSGSRYYWYINTADDSSANNGSFDLFFLCF